MTAFAKAELREIAKLAREARIDLGQNAANGAKARPTVAQLNRTLGRLDAIENAARHALAASLPTFTE